MQRWLNFCVMALLIAALFTGTPAAADEVDDEWMKDDPMAGLWKTIIVPKHRATILYERNDGREYAFSGQDSEVKPDNGEPLVLDVYASEQFQKRMGTPFGTFAVAAAAGTIQSTATLPDGFYDASEYVDVPKQVLCNANLVASDNPRVYFRMLIEGRLIGDKSLGGLPKPIYKYDIHTYREGTGSYSIPAPLIDENVAVDMVAFDWSGDGWSDYVLSYPSDGGNGVTVRIALVYIDGKSLYDWLNGGGEPIFSFDTSCLFSDFDREYNSLPYTPAGSCRMAVGDIDGDRVPEIAVYNTFAGGDFSHMYDTNRLNVFRISADATTNKATFLNIHSDDRLGVSRNLHESVGIAMGDIDGDGFDEICALNAEWADVCLSILKWDGSKLVKKLDRSRIEGQYDIESLSAVTGPIDASIADLDGDGCGELVWVSPTWEKPIPERLLMRVHKWGPADSLSGAGNPLKYDIAEICGWKLNEKYTRYSMTTGMFNYPESGAVVTDQIAIAQMGEGADGNTVCDLDWGIYSWDSSGLKVLGAGSGGVLEAGKYIPKVVAADLYNESMVLGAPTMIKVTDNIEPLFFTQAPPRHWDLISGSFPGDVNPPDENGKSRVDAFFKLQGYATTIDSSSAQESIEMETDTDSGTWGANFGTTVAQTFKHKDAVPLFSASAKLAGSVVDKTTEGNTYTAKEAFSASAELDDQLYYRANDYQIWRYPVLFPESQRTMMVKDADGNDAEAQNYLQYVVPVLIETNFAPAPGRSVSWYEPLHDNMNLFTYPRRLEDIGGYPKGADSKDPEDPWLENNGFEIVRGNGQQIGNPDKSSFTAAFSQSQHKEELYSVATTLGGNVSVNIPLPSIPPTRFTPGIGWSANVSLAMDHTFQTATTTTSNASQMKGFTVSWPGAKTYANAGGFSTEDQQFKSDIGIFTQDNGSFSIGYAVSSLKSARSNLWGADSPYREHPDPGLLLPFRYLTSGKENDKLDKLLIRGLSFRFDDLNSYSFDKENLPGKALPIGKTVTGSFRVINYSFAPSGPLTASIYYQPLGASEYTPDLSKAQRIGDFSISGGIAGREEMPDKDNWEQVAFTWTTPKNTGLGYLHAKLNYDGDELSEANNYGYVLVGLYDPDNLGTFGQGRASNNDYLDLKIASLKAYALNDDGTTDEELDINSLPRNQEVEFECRVRLDAVGNPSLKALPLVNLILIGGKGSVLGVRQLPILRVGDEWVFRNTFNTANAVKFDTFRLAANSRYLKVIEEKEPANNIVALKLEQEHGDDGGGSSGCGMGFAPLALAFIGLLPLVRRRAKRV